MGSEEGVKPLGTPPQISKRKRAAHYLPVPVDEALYQKLQLAKEKGLRLTRWAHGLLEKNIDSMLEKL